MPHVDKHPPGEFCWMELATSDQAAAKNFYSALFGWAPHDSPVGPDDFYTIFSLDGRHCAAAYTLTAAERSAALPPHWNLYIAVENADAAAAKAAELGAKVLDKALDVMDAGRMAILQDPTGAVFVVWQANRNQGIGISGEPGAFCWADLNTTDRNRAKQFYSAFFNWKITPGEHKSESDYLHIQNGEQFIGGISPCEDLGPGVPPQWMIYFLVGDIEESAAKAKELGAKFYMPPTMIEDVGRMAIMADPQGAVSALFQPKR